MAASALAGRPGDFAVAKQPRPARAESTQTTDRSLFVLRQFESLPRPLVSEQARELLALLPPPYDLMARWQLYTGLRVSELLRLTVHDVVQHEKARRGSAPALHHAVRLIRK